MLDKLFYLIFLTYAIRPYGLRISLLLSFLLTVFIIIKTMKNNTFRFPFKFLLGYMFLFLSSFISYLYNYGSVDKSFITLYLAFVINSFGFYLYLRSVNLKIFTKKLIKFMYYLSIFAIIQQIAFLLNMPLIYDLHNSFGLVGGSNISDFGSFQLYRVYSIFTEPAHFAYFISFAIFAGIVSFNNKKSFFHKLIDIKEFIVIIVAFFMTFSFSMYIMVLIFVLLTSIKFNMKSFITISLMILLIVIAIQSEVISTKLYKIQNFNNIETKELGGTMFAITSNIGVTYDSLVENNFLFGKGMDTHRFNYDKFIGKYISYDSCLYGTNRVDASSMFLRILSEFGILGLVVFLIYLKIYYVKDLYIKDLSLVSMFAMLSYMVRTGDYGSVVFTFYLALFTATYYNAKYIKRKK